jgi:AAA+ superfamily predicted ATPase
MERIAMTDPDDGLDWAEVIQQTERRAMVRLLPEDDPIYIVASRALIGKGGAVQLALAMLQRALNEHSDFLDKSMSQGAISVIACSPDDWAPEVASALHTVVDAVLETRFSVKSSAKASAKEKTSSAIQKPFIDLEHGPAIFEPTSTRALEMRHFRSTVSSGRAAIVVVGTGATLVPTEVRSSVIQTLAVSLPDTWTLTNFAFATARNAAEEMGHVPPRLLPRRLPHGLVGLMDLLSPTLVDLTCSSTRGVRETLVSLDRVLRQQQSLRPSAQPGSTTLDTLHGMGDAATWGRNLAADLRLYKSGRLQWSEIDRGIVLVGDPGVGKTTFARALANTAGVPLITTSLADWQGTRDGHLGHLLSAMGASFDEARRIAPCIMLIDEIDSFPTRSDIRDSHRDYTIQVVNGLLAQLDGATPREGVVVIGACNDASHLDPALLRAGRLEHVVRIPRPDAAAIEFILRTHLRESLSDADLSGIARIAAEQGAVGADAERWCRGARRRARTADRDMVVNDLALEVGGIQALEDEAVRRRICIHEAGHAVAWAEMGKGVLLGVRSGRQGDLAAYNEVDISNLLSASITKEQAMLHIRALLAGRAAEEELLGAPSGGAGGSFRSDLSMATRLALLLVTSLGLDDHPEGLLYRFSGDHADTADILTRDPDLRERVAAILRNCHKDARRLVQRRRGAIDELALWLDEQDSLDADEVLNLLRVEDAKSKAS